jgi:predicted nucleic acid-binding protein
MTNGVDFLADTNILIYVMEDHPAVKGIMRCSVAVSVVTEIELLGKKGISSQEANEVRNLLEDCEILNLSSKVKELAIALKQQYSLKTPDAIIIATAKCFNLTLITADKRLKNIDTVNTIILDIAQPPS